MSKVFLWFSPFTQLFGRFLLWPSTLTPGLPNAGGEVWGCGRKKIKSSLNLLSKVSQSAGSWNVHSHQCAVGVSVPKLSCFDSFFFFHRIKSDEQTLSIISRRLIATPPIPQTSAPYWGQCRLEPTDNEWWLLHDMSVEGGRGRLHSPREKMLRASWVVF